MCPDELYKFYDGTLSSVRHVLHDIASNLEMDYLPKLHWSNMEMKSSRIMVKAIDKLLFERSTAAKPYQEDSSEFYLITGSIYTGQQGTVVYSMMAAARRGRRQIVKVKELQDKCILKSFKLSYHEKYEHVDPKSQDHKMARLQDDALNRMVVMEIEDGLLEEMKVSHFGKEQDIDGESEDDSEKKLVMVNEEG
ncbi:hypothetical protein Tco_0977952 [Tanacetum coccineum]|uniref:DNA-directed RNA polymerase n=1 Tax=Tanacetum coccineum TaxID=301880 RepID=A0ABQ5ELK8_9ASTR